MNFRKLKFFCLRPQQMPVTTRQTVSLAIKRCRLRMCAIKFLACAMKVGGLRCERSPISSKLFLLSYMRSWFARWISCMTSSDDLSTTSLNAFQALCPSLGGALIRKIHPERSMRMHSRRLHQSFFRLDLSEILVFASVGSTTGGCPLTSSRKVARRITWPPSMESM